MLVFALLRIHAGNTDSIIAVLRHSASDSAAVYAYAELSETCEPENILKVVLPAIKICQKNLEILPSASPLRKYYLEHLGTLLLNAGYYYEINGNEKRAINCYQNSLKIHEGINFKEGISTALNNLGSIYYLHADLSVALDYYLKSLHVKEEIKYKKGIANTLQNIAIIYDDQGNSKKALEFCLRGLGIRKELKDNKGIINSYNNLSRIYGNSGNYDKALEYSNQSLLLAEKIQDPPSIAKSLTYMGKIFKDKKDFKHALGYAKRGMIIGENIDDKHSRAQSLLVLGDVYLQCNKLDSALYFAQLGFKLAEELAYPDLTKGASEVMHKIYYKLGKFEKAYKMHVLFKQMTDSLNKENNRKELIQKELHYEYAKKAAEDSIRTQEERKVMQYQMRSERNFSTAIGIILVLSVIFAAFVYYRYQVSLRQKKIIERSNKQLNETQEKLQKAKEDAESANRAKDEFVANISHEIRTPLNAVLGYSELLKGKTIDAKHEKYVENILSGGNSLLSLINDFLDLSKIEAGHLSINVVPVNLTLLLTECRQMFLQKAEEKNLNLHVACSNEVPEYCLIDETRVRQILFNLLGNAIKFTSTGSVNLFLDFETNEVETEKGNLKFIISDTGIGIPPDQQKIIFQAFKQQAGQNIRKYGGTGLGLTITQKLVQALGGKLELESAVNTGSKFKAYLPAAKVKGKVPENPANELTYEYQFKNQTILLVEDIESNRELICGYLEFSNLHLVMAANGLEALRILKDISPQLILSDILMPEMDGKTLIKAIRAMPAFDAVPILALTASGLEESSDDEIKGLVERYIRKPVSKYTVLKALSDFLDHEKISVDKNGRMNQHGLNENDRVRLEKELLPLWNITRELMSVDDIAFFSQQVLKFATTCKCDELAHYANNLSNYAANFEIEEMNEEYMNFKLFLKADAATFQ